MIPCRFTLETKLSPDQVIAKLTALTDTTQRTWFAQIPWNPHYTPYPVSTKIFAGRIDQISKSFKLHHYYHMMDRSQTVYRGVVYREGSATLVRVWVSFGLGVSLVLFAGIFVLLHTGFTARSQELPKPILWQSILILLILSWSSFSLVRRWKAKKMLRDLLNSDETCKDESLRA